VPHVQTSPLVADDALAGIGRGDVGELALEGRGSRPAIHPFHLDRGRRQRGSRLPAPRRWRRSLHRGVPGTWLRSNGPDRSRAPRQNGRAASGCRPTAPMTVANRHHRPCARANLLRVIRCRLRVCRIGSQKRRHCLIMPKDRSTMLRARYRYGPKHDVRQTRIDRIWLRADESTPPLPGRRARGLTRYPSI